mgnify:CR=1 FL=1
MLNAKAMTVEELKALDRKYRNVKVPKEADSIDLVKKMWEAMNKPRSVYQRAADREARFVLQRHYTLHRVDDPSVKGKSVHFDIRIRPEGSKTWFGFALKKDPRKLKPGQRTIAPPKGVRKSDVKEGSEYSPREIKNMYWFNVKYDEFPPGFPGNWTKHYITAIERIDQGRCVIHRRENDFLDVTFYGKDLKGRWYFRLVEPKDGEPYWIAWPAKHQEATKSEGRFLVDLVRSAMFQDETFLRDALCELAYFVNRLKEVS